MTERNSGFQENDGEKFRPSRKGMSRLFDLPDAIKQFKAYRSEKPEIRNERLKKESWQQVTKDMSNIIQEAGEVFNEICQEYEIFVFRNELEQLPTVDKRSNNLPKKKRGKFRFPFKK